MNGTESREPGASVDGEHAPPEPARAVSLELLRAFLALMPDAAVVVDAAGSIVSANEQAESLFGYPAGSLDGLSIENLVPERARSRHRRHRLGYAAAAEKRPMGAGLHLMGRRRDGEEFPLDVSLALMTASGEQFVVAAVRDMTEQRSQAAVQAQLATIVETSTDAIISMSVEGRILSWNPAAEELLGYARGEIFGQHIAALVPRHESIVLEELLDLAYQRSHRGARDTQWCHRDGHLVEVAVSISPMQDAGGQLLGFSAMVRDIRERKDAENELRRLLAERARFERQHAVTAEIRLALLSGVPLQEALALICERAVELVHSPVAMICKRGAGGFRIVAATGATGRPLVGAPLPVEASFAGEVIDSGEVIEATRRSERSPAEGLGGLPGGPVLSIPVVAGGGTSASLSVLRQAGGEPYAGVDRLATEALGAQAALAFELDRARADREQVILVGDRERIARDLHDLVIQRLYAVGMRLQAAMLLSDRPIVQERISETVGSLDETIREIRNTIFAITRSAGDSQLRGQVLAIVEASRGTLGFAPRIRFEGAVDATVPDQVVAHAVAVVHEAVSNAARHARASSLTIRLGVEDGVLLVVEVTDDGVGIGEPARSSGLANLEERARLLHGRFEAVQRPEGGTRLTWEVPLDQGTP